MLQQEHEKAQKKIQETSKKTDELIQRKNKNDEKYQRVRICLSYPSLGTSRARSERKGKEYWGTDESRAREAEEIVDLEGEVRDVQPEEANRAANQRVDPQRNLKEGTVFGRRIKSEVAVKRIYSIDGAPKQTKCWSS